MNVSSISRALRHRQRYVHHLLWIASRDLLRSPQFPIVLEVVLNTASDTVELRSAVAVNEEVTKTVQRLVDEFATCLKYLSEPSDRDISLPDAGDRVSLGRTVVQSRIHEGRPADPQIVKTIISELSAFLCIPTETVREEHSLFSFGLDSLKAAALSRRLRERGVYISPVDIIQAGSIRGVASATAIERREDISTLEESDTELERLLKQGLPVEWVRLGKDDRVKITATTALQAGMLSQVTTSRFCGSIGCSMTFHRRPLLPRGSFTYMLSHSSFGNHAKSNA